MTGLDEIRGMIAAGLRPPMIALLDISLLEVEEGRVVFGAVPGRSVYNAAGIVHGGYAATLLDTACGVAASSATKAPQNCMTLELKVAYHRAMDADTGPVRAIGTVVSIGKRVAHTEARLVDDRDRLYASATSTLLLSDRRQGEKVGKEQA